MSYTTVLTVLDIMLLTGLIDDRKLSSYLIDFLESKVEKHISSVNSIPHNFRKGKWIKTVGCLLDVYLRLFDG